MCFNCIISISVQPIKIANQRLQQFCYRIRSVHGEPEKNPTAPPLYKLSHPLPNFTPKCSICVIMHGYLKTYFFCSKWDGNHGPTNARLYHMAGGGKTGAWSSRINDKSQWIQVDLRVKFQVTKIATQGRQDLAQWVTQYKVSYSIDGKVFVSQSKVSKCKRKLGFRITISFFLYYIKI